MKKNIGFIFGVLFTLLIIFVFRYYIGAFIRVSGDSMSPTLRNNDYLWCDRVTDYSELQKGDIIVFDTERGRLVKRIYALPNSVFEDGYTLEHEYWVLGDNTEVSIDSREFGPIQENSIKYKYSGMKVSSMFYVLMIILIAVLLFGISLLSVRLFWKFK